MDGYFRSKKGYTVVQNDITDDYLLSLKAKGLYLLIQSKITTPYKKWKKSEFIRKSRDGEKSFCTAWNELKEHGYLKVHMYPNGNSWRIEFELLNEASAGAHTFYYNAKGDLTSTNLTRSHNRAKKDNESNVIKASEQRIPLLGSNANDSIAEGHNANDPNNNNYYNITPHNNTYIVNPSINSSTEAQKDRLKDTQCAVVLDPFLQLDSKKKASVTNILEAENGIPYYIIKDMSLAQDMIQVLSDWNELANSSEYSDMEKYTYRLAVQSLIEMVTSTQIQKYNGTQVSSANVIDQLNIIYRENSAKSLRFFVENCTEIFICQLREKKIPYPEAYMKSVIWSNIGTFKLKWEGFFYRTYNNVANE